MEDQRLGAVYWIDHFVVPTNDLGRWFRLVDDLIGATPDVLMGMSTVQQKGGRPLACFSHLEYCHLGAFLQDEMLPQSAGLTNDLPRYGFFVRSEDIDEHRRRLDRLNVPHTDPIRTSAEGQDGTAVYWEDGDGNQFEFWAPEHMPPGAMEGSAEQKVGRIASAAYASRDLGRTADFFTRFCGVDPIFSADVPKDTLSLGLAGGGRLVFKRADDIPPRSSGLNTWRGAHAALAIREPEYFQAYQQMWDALPENDYREQHDDPRTLPAHTGVHGSQAGVKFKEIKGRGDGFVDWDCNSFHFVGGIAQGGSMTTYRGRYMEDYVQEIAAKVGAEYRPVR